MENKELMNAKLMEILKEALYEYRKNLEYFEAFKEAEDAEIRQIYWSRSEEHDGKCEGLLTAYEILTGRAVLSHLIREEIKHLNKKF